MRHLILLVAAALAFGLTGAAPSQAAPPGQSAAPARLADRDCGDFSTQAAAQRFFLAHGGPSADPHRLDADGDGIACDANPCPCSDDTSPGPTDPPTNPIKRNTARVVKVFDGDTIAVRFGGSRFRVQLIGINAPEARKCGGKAAARALRKPLPRGTRVLLTSDRRQPNRDGQNRLLRYVAKRGHDLDKQQVRRGWAKVYAGKHSFQRVGAYRGAARWAKSHHRGVWRFCR